MLKFDKILFEFKKYFQTIKPDAELICKFGAELEFYFDTEFDISKHNPEVKRIQDYLIDNKLIECLEKEDGVGQFEVNFFIETDPAVLVKKINLVKDFLLQNNCILEAKPKIAEPSSSIHISVSLFLNGINLFQKNPKTEEYLIFLKQAIGGLIYFMNDSIYIFAPTPECYRRLKSPLPEERHIHYPTNCSWGFNNRTTAIRVPTIFSKKYPDNRIEHRVCSPLADIEKALFVVLYSIYYGISNFIDPIEPIFGNAFDDEFDYLSQFPVNLEKAKKLFERSKLPSILRDFGFDV
jgi:glutamine synthetase